MTACSERYPDQVVHGDDIVPLYLLPDFRYGDFVELQPMVDTEEDSYWPDDRHLNINGKCLTGLLFSRCVLEQPFLELPDKNKRLSDVN